MKEDRLNEITGLRAEMQKQRYWASSKYFSGDHAYVAGSYEPIPTDKFKKLGAKSCLFCVRISAVTWIIVTQTEKIDYIVR